MWRKIIDFVSLKLISPLNWGRIKFMLTGREFNLLPKDREHARMLMARMPLIWVSRRRSHLSSYLISMADFALGLSLWAKSKFKGRRPRWGYWTHAFLSDEKHMVIEAVAKGVKETYFDDVFDCDAVAALVPRNLSVEAWTEVSHQVVKEARTHLGKKYDTVFNVADESEVSCIELVRLSLKIFPDYEFMFRDFEDAIRQYKNLTPQMLYESRSFRVVWEVRR